MEAVYYLNEWHDEMMSRSADDRDPLWTVMKEGGPFHAKGYLKNYVARLEATGRSKQAEALRVKHPQEFGDTEDEVMSVVMSKIRSKMFGHS